MNERNMGTTEENETQGLNPSGQRPGASQCYYAACLKKR